MMQQRTEADIVLENISQDYPVWERAVREAAPELSDAEVHERALRSVLAQLRYDLSKETFGHVRDRLARAKREAFRMRGDAIATRERARNLRERASEVALAAGWRTFRDGEGQVWGVREVAATSPWRRGETCLVFSSEMAVRRVWTVPPGWHLLSDRELEQLSWGI